MTFAPKRLFGLAGGMALAFCVGAAPAKAVTIGPNFCLAGSTTTSCGIQLDIPDAALQPYTGPYVHGQVTIVDSDTLRFSFTGLSSGNFRYFFDNVALDLVPASTFTGTFVSGTWGASQGGPGGHTAGSALTSADVHFGADLDEGSFGHSFGVVSESAGGSQGFSSSLSALAFDVTWGSGTNWTNLLTQQFMDLSEHGSDCQGGGCSAAGHVYVANISDGPPTGAVATGFAGWPDACDQRLTVGCQQIVITPEPSSLALLGGALLGLGILGRRRRRTAA